jgi:hypothetical protein
MEMATHEKRTCVQYRNINYGCKKVLENRAQVTSFLSVFLHQKTLKPSKAKKGFKIGESTTDANADADADADAAS